MKSHIPSKGELCSPARSKGMKNNRVRRECRACAFGGRTQFAPTCAVEQTGDVETQESYEIAYPK